MCGSVNSIGEEIAVSVDERQELESKLWQVADKLRNSIDAAEYKHIVLGLIFLKYVSDRFVAFRKELRARLIEKDEEVEAGLEDRDEYLAENVFWLPPEARWLGIQKRAKQPDIGRIIDNAMLSIEKENPRLKNVLPKDFARRQADIGLGELVDLVATIGIGFDNSNREARDVLGHVYEYFLGQFASAEGKKGGQFYTPKSVVNLIVACLEPYKGRVYDPAMGSGGFLVSSKKFIEEHTDKRHVNIAKQQISLYGQESNPTTWRLSVMNMALRGIEFNFGKHHADTFHHNQHPGLQADFIMANPPFNTSDWGGDKLENDQRWQYGIPPRNNANFAWLQHMIHHLSPRGYAGIVLANGSLSTKTNNEGTIRQNIVTADLVDCMIALPPQLFFNTQIPACIWILAKDKSGKDDKRARQHEVLFIDAREYGTMISRAQRELQAEDINAIAGTYHSWRNNNGNYKDKAGFCKSVKLEEVAAHKYVLTPGLYVGLAEREGDGRPFAEKIQQLTDDLAENFAKSHTLEQEIKKNMRGLGFDL